MNISLSDCRERIREATLNLLWQQWCSLGVAGNADPVSEDRLIDLDALVLATTSIGRCDPRLFDEALDWLWHEADQPRWKVFVEDTASRALDQTIPLFLEQGNLHARHLDPVFSKHGLERKRRRTARRFL